MALTWMADASKDDRVLTPMGLSTILRADSARDQVAIVLDERIGPTAELCTLYVDEHALKSPLLKHFPDDDPVVQYELWSQTDWVVELCTVQVQAPCRCGCKACSMTPTAAWVLGSVPRWQGAVHDTTGGCQCLTAAICPCMNEPLPEIDHDWFITTVAGITP